jgi:hypothetical protein
VPIEPFRFLHTGDLHLDSPFVGLTAQAPPEVARALRESTLQAWDRIVKLGLDEQVDFAVVAGDVFEHANRPRRLIASPRVPWRRCPSCEAAARSRGSTGRATRFAT